MKIDDQVESRSPEAPSQRHILQGATESLSPSDGDEIVEIRILRQHRGRVVFDEIGQVRIRNGSFQGADRRSGEDDVADQAQPDQENPHVIPCRETLVLDGRLVDKHDRNIILDRVDPPAGVALQTRVVVDEDDTRLAVGAGQYFQ